LKKSLLLWQTRPVKSLDFGQIWEEENQK